MRKKLTSFILIVIMLVTNLFSSASIAFAQSNLSGQKSYQIKNPYETVDWKTYGQYKANFHSHSVESDGGNTPKEMLEDHYAKGFDIAALTDHNNVNSTWDRTDSTNKDAVYLTPQRLAEMTAGTDRSGRGITAIPYSDEQSSSDHVNTFWANFNNKPGDSLESNIAKAQELGGISHINHPGRYTGGSNTANNGADGAAASNDPKNVKKYVDLFTKYSSCVGMEIINKKDGDSYSDRILWDNILKEEMPNRPVWGFSNDDAHSTSAVGYSYNMMLMPQNTEQNVRNSMENGTFYAVAKVAKRELGTSFVANGPTPKITDIAVDKQNNSITIQGENYNKIEWIADGKVIAEGNTIDLDDYEDKVNNYIRAQLKGDGGISFTQPFGITVVDETKKPEQIALSMTTDPQTSIGINWTTLDTTLTGAKVTVWEKSAGENTAKSYDANVEKRDVSKSTIPGVTQKNFYAVTVNGLKPDTEYNYRVGASGVISEVRSFKTAQADEKPYTFIYFGDPQMSGNNSKGWNADLDIAKSKYPDAKFLYVAGDLTNSTADEGQWESFFNQPGNAQYNDKFSGSFISELPVAATMGNHDGSNAGAGGISSHYTFGSQVNGVPVTYAYTYGSARFIVINTQYNNLDSAEQAKQTEFVKKETAAAKATGKWAIVELHKPPYTGASHLSDSDLIASRKYWSSVLAGIGVDAVLAGHDHVLSRGFVKADGTKVDVTKKIADRVYTAQQPDNAPLYFVANTSSTLKFYAPVPNNDWIQPNDPVAPSYGFLDIDSALPAGNPLNPLGPCTNDDLDGTEGFLRLPAFTAVTVSKDSIKFDTYMTGFDRNTNTIVKDTFLYDSFTVNRSGVSKVETESQLKRIAIKADGNTLPSDSSTSIKLSLTGKDNFENEKSISGTVQYKTDKADILSVSADGTVTLKNQPTENTIVNVWAEVTNGEKTIISDKVPIKVNGLGKLESVTIAADHTTLNRTNTAQLSITGKHSSGASVDFSKASVQYTSSNPSIVSVDDKGVITANKVGSADITAIVTLDGTVVQSNTVTITVNELSMDAVQLGINTDKTIVGVGEELQVKLNAKGVKDLYGFDSTFNYDPSLFELESVTVDKDFAADSTKAFVDYKDDNGKVRIVASLIGVSEGVTGDKNIIDVKLKAKNKDAKTSFIIAKGAAVSDSKGATFKTSEDVVSELTVANADVTGGGIAINDLVLVAKAFGTISNSQGYNAAFDMNKDGIIDIVDISYVAKKVLGL